MAFASGFTPEAEDEIDDHGERKHGEQNHQPLVASCRRRSSGDTEAASRPAVDKDVRYHCTGPQIQLAASTTPTATNKATAAQTVFERSS